MRMLSRVTSLVVLGGMLSAVPARAETRVFVRIGPPPIVVEHVVPQPRGYYVYQPGYHQWTGARYVWVSGQYVRPPYRHAHWRQGYWRHERRGYYYVQGYWRR